MLQLHSSINIFHVLWYNKLLRTANQVKISALVISLDEIVCELLDGSSPSAKQVNGNGYGLKSAALCPFTGSALVSGKSKSDEHTQICPEWQEAVRHTGHYCVHLLSYQLISLEHFQA